MGFSRTIIVITSTIILLIIVIAITIPYALLVRIMEFNQMYLTMHTYTARISEIYPLIKTGDIILYVSTCHLPSHSGMAQTFFSHIGILMREGDLVYTSETSSGSELMPNPDKPGTHYYMAKGASVSPLLTRMKFYQGSIYIMQLSHALDPIRENIIKSTSDNLCMIKYPYPTLAQTVITFATGAKSKSRHCFQHVAHILDEAGLTPINRTTPLADAGFIKVCADVCELPNVPLPDGYYYKPPIHIIYDVNILNL